MREVAAFYGFQEDRRHLCLCPFHKDRHPSMRVYPNDKGFYCFSCGKGGDVVTFVAALYELHNDAACRKLIEDFSLPVALPASTYREKREREKRIRHREAVARFRDEAQHILGTYRIKLCEATREFGSPHFTEAFQELSVTEYRLQCLMEDPEAYYADKKAVRKIGEIRDRIDRWDDYPGSEKTFSR